MTTTNEHADWNADWTNEETYVVESGLKDSVGRTIGVIVLTRHVKEVSGFEHEYALVHYSRNGKRFGPWSDHRYVATVADCEEFVADVVTRAMARIRKAA